MPIWWKVAGIAALLALLVTVGNTFFTGGGAENSMVETSGPLKTDPPPTNPKNETVTVGTPSENSTTTEENLEENNSQLVGATPAILEKKGAVADRNTKKRKAAPAIAVSSTYKKGGLNKKNSVTSNAIKTSEENAVVAVRAKKETAVSTEKNASIKNPNAKNDIAKKAVNTGVVAEAVPAKRKNPLQKTGADRSITDAVAAREKAKKELKKDIPAQRWEVSPNFAPVYYSSINGGSSLDPSFADNPQSGNINFSYGVGVSYKINARLQLRTGVNNVNLGYGTSGVEIASGPVAAALRSIDYGTESDVVTAVDKGELNMPESGSGFEDLQLKSDSPNARVFQELSYFEVPFELSYTLVNNRFSISVIGGFSTLFLNNNEVFVRADDFFSVLGPANNLNNVSFATNAGIGFGYDFTKKLRFNLEPMFKYQLNPYSDTSINYRPYYLGVYSGLSFKF